MFGQNFILIAFVLNILTACGEDSHTASSQSTIFDQSEIRLLSLSERNADKIAAAIGNLLVIQEFEGDLYANSYCSGVQVSRRHILTAAHCVKDDIVFDKNQISTDADLNKLEFVVFGDVLRLHFDGEKIPEADLAKQRQKLHLVFKDEAADFAILESRDEMNEHSIDLSNLEPLSNDSLNDLTLYGHPNGTPLSVSDQCDGFLSDEYRFFLHSCDALVGSSGGLIATKVGRPVALHQAGPAQNSGQFYKASGHFESIDKLGRNKSILLSDVVKILRQDAPSVWQKLTLQTSSICH